MNYLYNYILYAIKNIYNMFVNYYQNDIINLADFDIYINKINEKYIYNNALNIINKILILIIIN